MIASDCALIAYECIPHQVLEQDAVAMIGRLGLSATDASSGYSVFNSLITVVINMLLKESVTQMTKWERRDTQTEFETSLFAKLSLAYIFNAVIIPLAVGIGISLRVTRGAWPVTQSWYEGGGVVQVAVPLIVSNGLITVLQVVQPAILLSRHVLARCVVSQAKMNELWEPPEMLLGELYASSLKWEEHASAHHGAPLSPQVRLQSQDSWALPGLRAAVAVGLPAHDHRLALQLWVHQGGRRILVQEAADGLRGAVSKFDL